jgi:very-short-patch-repair endonuclease
MKGSWLCDRGHLARTSELVAAGASRRQLARAVAMGELLRLAPGRYACAHIDEVARHAATSGCRVDCISALARHGVWSGIAQAGLHLRAVPGRHLVGVPQHALVHRNALRTSPHGVEVSPVDAVLRAMRCLAPYDALASVESALHVGYLDEIGLRTLIDSAPRWMMPTLDRLDRGAQSGLETHARLRLQDAGHSVVSQVRIPGAGILDLLVDDCVGVETDGSQWHAESFLSDRAKDIGIETWGIRVLRIGAPHVFRTWPDTILAIERMVADAPPRARMHGTRR